MPQEKKENQIFQPAQAHPLGGASTFPPLASFPFCSLVHVAHLFLKLLFKTLTCLPRKGRGGGQGEDVDKAGVSGVQDQGKEMGRGRGRVGRGRGKGKLGE